MNNEKKNLQSNGPIKPILKMMRCQIEAIYFGLQE